MRLYLIVCGPLRLTPSVHMASNPKGHAQGRMASLRASVPQETSDWFREQAEREGIPIQAVLAPVLNAYARGEITQGFTRQPGDVRK